MRRLVAPAAVLAALFAVWELVVRVGWVDELLLPAPTQVAQALWVDRALLAPDLLTTTWEVVVGLLAALALGAALAVGALSSLYPTLRASRLDPSEAVRHV